MNTRGKLEIIRQRLGLTQSEMALKFGVSFAAFNSWWNEKSAPRPKAAAMIEELFLEVTGQKIIPDELLDKKKKMLSRKSSAYGSTLSEILDHPDIRDEFILKLTYHSGSIEGSTLTEPDTAAILFNNTALPDKSLTEQMEAKNHQTALNYLLNHIKKNGAINEDLILKLHGILMNGIWPDAGFYRRHPVRITGVNLPTANHLKIPDLIPKLINSIPEKIKDAISLSAETHSEFEKIHPFSDGNGRVGRLLINAILLKANLAPAIIRQEQKQLYYTYLYKAQTKGDHSQLENFLCDAAIDGFKILERE